MSYTVTVSPKPTTASAGPNDKTCNTSYTLAGNTPVVGTGIWSVSTGPAATFTSPNSPTSTVTGLSKGTRYGLTWTISNASCTNSAATVTVDVLSDIINTIQSNVPTVCPGQPVNFSTQALSGGDVPASLAASYTYLWESSTDGVTWTTISGATLATLTANPSVNTYYRRTVSSYGKCPVVSNSVQITMNAVAPVAAAGSNINVCNQTQAQLAGNNPGVFAGTWADTAPGSTITFTPNANTYNAVVNGLVPGVTYHLTWSIASPACGLTTSPLTITDLAPITNTIGPLVTTICAGQSATITGANPTGGTGTYAYTWESSPDQVTWTIIAGQTGQNITLTPASTLYIRRDVTSGTCSSVSSAVNVIVQPALANNLISADQQVCSGSPVNLLTGATPTGGDGNYSYQWQKSSDQVAWTNIGGATAINYQPPAAPNAITYYRRLVTTVLCTGPQQSTSNTVKVAINPVAIADFTASSQTGCTPFNLATVITGIPHNAVDASYTWFANGTQIGTGSAFPGYTINTDGQSVTIMLVVTSTFGCVNDTKSLVFTSIKNVTAAFTKDQTKACGPVTVHFTNTSAPLGSATYQWDFGNGQTSTLVQPNAVTYLPHPLNRDTTYVITLKATAACGISIYKDSVLVRPKPIAIFTPDNTSGCSPMTVHFVNQSRGVPNVYTFDFGDGIKQSVSTNQAIQHTYTTAVRDTFTVKLIAQNECGIDSSSYQIVVYPNQVVANLIVNGNNKAGCAPYTVQFNNTSTGANVFNYDFKDGTTVAGATSPETVYHTFTTPGIYNVTLTASNGCSSQTATQTITIVPAPVVKFAIGQPAYCVKDSAVFTNQTASIGSFSYLWNFGDGTTSNQLNPKHSYATPGNYTVTLIATQNAAGTNCGTSISHTVSILPIPVAAFTTNSGAVNCAPYLLSVNTPTTANTFAWDFGDPAGTIVLGSTAQHLYTKPGFYRVKLTAYGLGGCTDSIIQVVKITETPKAAFTPGDTIICSNNAVINLKNTTTYSGVDPVSYQWIINNNIVSTLKNFTYAFNAPGGVLPYTFQVKLVASSSIGCPDTVIHNFHFNPIPVAAFSVAANVSCAPFNVKITNNTTYASSYKWYLNNQLVSTSQTPTNIVLTQGNTAYNLKLVASNIFGCRPDSITMGLSTFPKPKAAFSLLDTVACKGQLDIKVTNTSTGATSYTWIFGDGSPVATGAVPTHIYTLPGTYRLQLIASNGTCPDTVTHTVKVANVPKASFAANIVKGCTLLTPTFTNASVNATAYLWDFGDGTVSTLKNPTHSFSYVNAPYTVRLIAYGEFGCSDTITVQKYINVAAPPVADFVVVPDSVIAIPNHSFQFNKIVAGTSITNYNWDFGDGKTSTDSMPSHVYSDTGKYKVKFTVTNVAGCQSTRIRTVQITGIPLYLYVPNAFEPGSSKSELQTFNVRAFGLADYTLKVFNKWGQVIFQTSALDVNGTPTQGWDGMMQGAPAPQGVYVWEISAHFINGTQWTGMKYNDGRAQSTVGIIHLIR